MDVLEITRTVLQRLQRDFSSGFDYSVVSANLLQYLTNFSINEVDDLFSDGHSLLTTKINFVKVSSNSQNYDETVKSTYPKWQSNKVNDFIHNIDLNKVESLENLLDNFPIQIVDQGTAINNVTAQISKIFEKSVNLFCYLILQALVAFFQQTLTCSNISH